MINKVDAYINKQNIDFNINIMHCGIENRKDHVYGPLIIDRYVLQYVISGQGIYMLDKKKYIIKKGDIFLVPAGHLCYYKSDINNPYCYYYVAFNGASVNSLLKRAGLTVNNPIACLNNEKVSNFMKNIYENLKIDTYTSITFALANLCMIFGEMFSLIPNNNVKNKTKSVTYIEQIKSYIENNYYNRISVKEISESIELNRTYLSTLFRKNMGVKLNEYLIQYRISQAIKMLENSDMTITEISDYSGFTSAQNFFIRFKQRMGISPSEYRKRYIKYK